MFCAIVIFVVTCSVQADPITWETSTGGNGHSYEFVHVAGGITWTDASLAAQTLGGHLATVTSEAENEFIFGLIENDGSAWKTVGQDTRGPWLGGFQTEAQAEPDEWLWVTGEDFSYSNWALSADGTQQPFDRPVNEDWLHFLAPGQGTRASTWNDLLNDGGNPSDMPTGFIVEHDQVQVVPEPSSLAVLSGIVLCMFWVGRRKRFQDSHREGGRRAGDSTP